MKSCMLQTDMLPIYLSRKDKARHTCIFSYLDTLCCFSSIVSSWLSGGLIRNRQLKLRLLLADRSEFQPMKIHRPWKIITWIMSFLPTDTRPELVQLVYHTYWNQLTAPTYKSDNKQNKKFPLRLSCFLKLYWFTCSLNRNVTLECGDDYNSVSQNYKVVCVYNCTILSALMLLRYGTVTEPTKLAIIYTTTLFNYTLSGTQEERLQDQLTHVHTESINFLK
jgi:hypothetical protein